MEKNIKILLDNSRIKYYIYYVFSYIFVLTFGTDPFSSERVTLKIQLKLVSRKDLVIKAIFH